MLTCCVTVPESSGGFRTHLDIGATQGSGLKGRVRSELAKSCRDLEISRSARWGNPQAFSATGNHRHDIDTSAAVE